MKKESNGESTIVAVISGFTHVYYSNVSYNKDNEKPLYLVNLRDEKERE